MHTGSDHKSISRAILMAAMLPIVIVIVGTTGYMLIEKMPFFDAMYMTVISATTTGFSEISPMSVSGRLFTVLIITMGIVSIGYLGGRTFQLFLAAYMIRRKKMNKAIDKLNQHIVVCGFGRMGRHVCRDLESEKMPFVVVENDKDLVSVLETTGYLFVTGDASSDEILESAGVRRAKGLISVVSTDADNTVTTLTAKTLNPHLLVVTRAVNRNTEHKLKKAGADKVIKPYELAGQRLTQLVLRPGIVAYMETIAQTQGKDISIEEICLSSQSSLIRLSLAKSPLRSALNIIVVAIHRPDDTLLYNPPSDIVFRENDRLVAIGERHRLRQLGQLCVR